MNFNFFEWIRLGVRQSVLLGVSDAVEQMGMPHDTEAAQKQLLDVFRREPTPPLVGLPSAGNSRKKLGRSLKQIQAAGEKAA
jgi:hypothetical protein